MSISKRIWSLAGHITQATINEWISEEGPPRGQVLADFVAANPDLGDASEEGFLEAFNS